MLPFLENTWSIVDFGSKLGMQHVLHVHVWEENAASRLKFSWKKYIACVVYKLCVVWIYKFQIREKMSMKCVLVSVSCPGHLKSINLIANNITNCAFYNVRSHKSSAVIYSAQPLFLPFVKYWHWSGRFFQRCAAEGLIFDILWWSNLYVLLFPISDFWEYHLLSLLKE